MGLVLHFGTKTCVSCIYVCVYVYIYKEQPHATLALKVSHQLPFVALSPGFVTVSVALNWYR